MPPQHPGVLEEVRRLDLDLLDEAAAEPPAGHLADQVRRPAVGVAGVQVVLAACLDGLLCPAALSAGGVSLTVLTSFQAPWRRAPRLGSTLSRISSWGAGLPWAMVGQRSLPSSGCFCWSDAPASFNSVGYQST